MKRRYSPTAPDWHCVFYKICRREIPDRPPTEYENVEICLRAQAIDKRYKRMKRKTGGRVVMVKDA